MASRRRRWISAVLLLVLAMVVGPTGSFAAERKAKPKSRKVQALREFTFEKLSKAHELLAAEKYGDALAVLDEMQGRKRLNDHENALMWQTYAYVYSAQDRYSDAAASFEKCLATGGLPEQSEINTHYNLGQLYMALQRYPEAIKSLLVWFDQAENPAPNAHFVLAMAYVQNKQMDEALPHAEQAVAKTSEAKESWLQLLLALYLEKNRYAEAAPVLKQLVERFPKKTYMLQLSAVYTEFGQRKKALAAMELAYFEGLLSKDSEYRTLTQLYLYNDLPYDAGQVLEEGLAKGSVEKDAESWALLADCWLHARERARALEPLQRAAAASADGNLYVRLGRVHVDEERWDAAREALTAALRKGDLKDPGNAQLLLGVANAGANHWEEAQRAFRQAQQHEKTKDAATQWLTHLQQTAQLAPGDKAEAAAATAEGDVVEAAKP
jgi:lipopolysaccharide biosynthesis regulator YciM